jgi:hypothetical protein
MIIGDAQVSVQVIVHDSKSGGASGKARTSSLAYNQQNTYTSGTANNQINQEWDDARTLSASANEVLDLNGTALKDDYGDNLALTKIKELVIENTSATGTLSVGGGTSNLVADVDYSVVTKTIPPKGRIAISNPLAGWTVTPTTGDLLKITNGDGSNATTYNIAIIGIQ